MPGTNSDPAAHGRNGDVAMPGTNSDPAAHGATTTRPRLAKATASATNPRFGQPPFIGCPPVQSSKLKRDRLAGRTSPTTCPARKAAAAARQGVRAVTRPPDARPYAGPCRRPLPPPPTQRTSPFPATTDKRSRKPPCQPSPATSCSANSPQ
jgi:hypothetical protein